MNRDDKINKKKVLRKFNEARKKTIQSKRKFAGKKVSLKKWITI